MTLSHVEPDRLESLGTYGLSSPEVDLDLGAVVQLAAASCRTSVAQVAVVEADCLRVVAGVGGGPTVFSREGSFSAWVVDNQVELTVRDGRRDPRFAQHPRVQSGASVAYAGVPLIGRDGLPLGTLCVVDSEPRDFSAADLEVLRALAQGIISTLELRRVDRYRGAPADASQQGRRLRRALDSDELEAWFQPIVALRDGTPWALEALVRWRHPHRGLLTPEDFLPAIEHSGLSMPLGRTILHQSLRAMADLRSRVEVPDLLLVAVNVSPLQLERPGLAASVLADLEAHRIAPEALSLEVTEHGVLHQDVAVAELQALRDAGVKIALDDFGTGRASLQTLLELPLSGLKLDGVLVRRLAHDARTRSVVRHTTDMARELQVAVIAEGVETDEQRSLLLELGCELGQGHAFSAAVAGEDLPQLLARMTPSLSVPARPKSGRHDLVRVDADVATCGADVLEPALRGTKPVVVIATDAHRVAVEQELARRGIVAVKRPGYVVVRAEDVLDAVVSGDGVDTAAFRQAVTALVPRGGHVWSDLAGALWARGEVAAAIELEDLLGTLPATVSCCHESWALSAHGTPQQVTRLLEQHHATRDVEVVQASDDPRAALRPAARDLIDRMLAAGASPHSVAAALNAEGHPTPWGVRWHWRQVERVRLP